MKIEIDQSGKLENTNLTTVIGFSNGKQKSIIISSREKIALQKHFRNAGKRKLYNYFTFAALIYLLLRSEKCLDEVVIDTEYPGQNDVIKGYLMKMFASSNKKIHKNQISFSLIGHGSKAHDVSLKAYRKKRSDIRVLAKDIVEILGNKKSGI